jgi:hypothetical protein
MSADGYSNKKAGSILSRFKPQRGLAFGVIIILALLAFEMFNFSTTEFALHDLLGDLNFFGIAWATILAIAFCGIDFAGIARLFTPEEGSSEPNEVWYLFGAWLLAATMNAMLTWWGVSIAILNNNTLGNAVVERPTLLRLVPIFVAVLVWLVRVLIIGTFSVAGNRLFTLGDQRSQSGYRSTNKVIPIPTMSRGQGQSSSYSKAAMPAQGSSFRPAPRQPEMNDMAYSRPEPTYAPLHSSSASANSKASFSAPDNQGQRSSSTRQ